MQGIPWEQLTTAVAAIVMVGMVCLAMFKFIGNCLASLTRVLGKLAEAITQLREHCAGTWVKVEAQGERGKE